MSSLSDQVGPEEDLVCFSGYVIAKNSRIKLYWDVLNNIMMLISYFLVPLQIAFGGPSTSEMHQLELILDIVVFLDVIFNFITDNQSDPGEIVTNKKIAFRYISSYFIFDVLSFLPGLVTFEYYGGFTIIYKLKLFRYLKLRRSQVQLDELIKESGKFFKEHISYNIRFVLNFLIQYTLMFHVMACIWIIIGSCNTPDTLLDCFRDQDGWVKLDFENQYGLGGVAPHL